MISTAELTLAELAKNPNLPTPPGVALRVLEKASAIDCDLEDLSKVIALDPGLSGKILKTVNSALFALPRPVTSIQRALSIIGLNSAKSLTLSLSIPEMHRRAERCAFMQEYWKGSVIGGIVMRDLAKRLRRREPEDDSVAGLLRDIGMVVLRQSFPDAYARILACPAGDLALNLCEWEQHFCGVDHAQVSAFLLKQWRFPDEFTEVIRAHHAPNSARFDNAQQHDRAYMLHFSSLVAQLQTTPDHRPTYESLLAVATERFGMNEEALIEFLSPLAGKVSEFAAILSVDIGRCRDYSEILARASAELVNLTLAVNLDNQRAQQEKTQAQSEAKRWREEAVFDPLTKAFNRRYLERQLGELFSREYPPDRAIGLLFIDLDGFKPLNDRFGHQFGDLVLMEVSAALRKQVRQGDVVARFGGDEFCVLVESTNETGLRCLADRIWAAIGAVVVRQDDQEGRVGASIGALVCHPQSDSMTPEQMLKGADQAMYKAKRGGKNRVVFLSEIRAEQTCLVG